MKSNRSLDASIVPRERAQVTPPRAPRVPSRAPIKMNGKSGVLQDISATGVFFEIDEETEPGSTIQFELELDTPGGKLLVVCSGEVARVVKLKGKLGIGVRIMEQEMRSVR